MSSVAETWARNCDRSLAYARAVCADALRLSRMNCRNSLSRSSILYRHPGLQIRQGSIGDGQLLREFGSGLPPEENVITAFGKRRHDAERNVARPVMRRVRMRHIVRQRADRRRPRLGPDRLALRERRGIETREQS